MIRISKKKLGITIGVIGILVLCSFYVILNQSKLELDEIQVYKKFLLGDTTASDEKNIELSINDLFENGDNIKYVFFDINCDSKEELHVRSEKSYYVLMYSDNVLKIIYSGSAYEYPVKEDNLCGILYYREGSAPYHETYYFTSFDESGQAKTGTVFEWYDDNEDRSMNMGDIYLSDGNVVNNWKEWVKMTQSYRKGELIGEEKWKLLKDEVIN